MRVSGAASEEQMRAYFVVAERKQASVRAGLMWRPGAGTAEEFERALEAAKFKENQGDDRSGCRASRSSPTAA